MKAPSNRKGGRPVAGESEQRMQHLVDTARRLFLAQGYEATSLEGIARAAGAAKTTIYRHFGSKKALFEKVVEAATQNFSVQLAQAQDENRSVEAGLRHIARCLLEVIYQPDSINLMRLFFAESPRFPEIGRAYDTYAKSVFMRGMADYLERCVEAGRMVVPDMILAADQFHHLVMSSRFFDVLLGVASIPDEREREDIATQAIGLFLAGYSRTPLRGA